MNKKIFMPILMVCLFLSISFACNGKIITMESSKQVYEDGEITEICFDIELQANSFEKCTFVIDVGIMPHNVPFSILVPMTYDPSVMCCRGNDNYDNGRFVLEGGLLGSTESMTVCLYPEMPQPDSFDHCASTEERLTGGFYHALNGEYSVKSWLVKDCYFALGGEEQVTYDTQGLYVESSTVYKVPDDPVDPIEPILDEDKTTCNIVLFGQCIPLVDFIFIIIIIVLFTIIIITLSRKKKVKKK